MLGWTINAVFQQERLGGELEAASDSFLSSAVQLHLLPKPPTPLQWVENYLDMKGQYSELLMGEDRYI